MLMNYVFSDAHDNCVLFYGTTYKFMEKDI